MPSYGAIVTGNQQVSIRTESEHRRASLKLLVPRQRELVPPPDQRPIVSPERNEVPVSTERNGSQAGSV